MPETINKQVLVRMWRKGNPHALLMGMQIGVAIVENSIEFPKSIINCPVTQQFH